MSRIPSLLLAAAFLVSCSRRHELLVHVMAKSAPGLKVGGRVQYQGADVGIVRAIYPTPSGVRIDVAIIRRDAPLRKQDAARIVTVGTFGEQVVQIDPGPTSAPLISPGGSLGAAKPTPDSAAAANTPR
jgi:ABC-type transporter Mla subunit MlaD